jgi:hypothetical protein
VASAAALNASSSTSAGSYLGTNLEIMTTSSITAAVVSDLKISGIKIFAKY